MGMVWGREGGLRGALGGGGAEQLRLTSATFPSGGGGPHTLTSSKQADFVSSHRISRLVNVEGLHAVGTNPVGVRLLLFL